MTRFLKSLLVSLAVHALLAATLAVYLEWVPLRELPHLDLSAVELERVVGEMVTTTRSPFSSTPFAPGRSTLTPRCIVMSKIE